MKGGDAYDRPLPVPLWDEETCLHILGTAGAIGCQAERSSEFPFGCSVIGTRDQVMRVKEDAECNLLDLIALYVP